MNYSERQEKLRRELKRGSHVILYIVEDSGGAQFRYRCNNLVETMEKSGWSVVWFLRSEIDRVSFDGVSLVVVVRQTDKNGDFSEFIKRVNGANIEVLFDLDDLIFDYRDLPLLMKATNSKNVAYWMGYTWGIRRIAKRVDGFTCTNEFLAEKLRRSFGKPVKVIRNSLNKEQIEVLGRVVKKKKMRKSIDDEFVIGYFSGSPTHVKDFALVEPELIRFLDNYKNVKLRIVGYMKLSSKMQELVESGRVEVMELVDYLRLQELMGEVDVNIAPLVINDFTNCKSELKFFEAAVVETTTIASPNYSFKKAIVDGENGFLAKPGEWYDKLEYLYEHPNENRKIALAAKEYALKHYYGKEFLKEVEAAYDYFAK